MYAKNCNFLIFFVNWQEFRSSNTPGTMNTPGTRSVSKYSLKIKASGLLEEIVELRVVRARKVQASPGTSLCCRKRKCSKNNVGLMKGYSSQIEALNHQTGTNWATKQLLKRMTHRIKYLCVLANIVEQGRYSSSLQCKFSLWV